MGSNIATRMAHEGVRTQVRHLSTKLQKRFLTGPNGGEMSGAVNFFNKDMDPRQNDAGSPKDNDK